MRCRMECLKTIAIYRFLLPDRQIKVCGGRERNLRELQSWIFMAGASAVAIGTMNFHDPMILPKLIDQLPGRMDELGIPSIEALIQSVKEARAHE